MDAGDHAGYHQATVPAAGHLVIIGAGSAAGVAELADGRSPFHYQRRAWRCTSRRTCTCRWDSCRRGDPLPAIGDRVDLQRPLITTAVDTYEWL